MDIENFVFEYKQGNEEHHELLANHAQALSSLRSAWQNFVDGPTEN